MTRKKPSPVTVPATSASEIAVLQSPTQMALYDFVREFPSAACENVTDIDAPWKRSVAVIEEKDFPPGGSPVLFTSPDTSVAYTLPGWDGAELAILGSVGFYPPAKAWGVSDGVRVCLDIETEGTSARCLDRLLMPGDADVPISVPLADVRGKPFRVVLRTVNDPGCHGQGDWIVWHGLSVGIPRPAVPWEAVGSCDSFGKGAAVVESVALCMAGSGAKAGVLLGGETVDLHLRVAGRQAIDHPIFGFTLNDRYGTTVLQANTFVYGAPAAPLGPGEVRTVRFRFVLPALRNGEFTVSPAVAEGTQDAHIQHHWVHDALVVRVLNPHPSRSLGSMVFIDDVRIEME